MSPDVRKALAKVEDDPRVARLAEARDRAVAEHGDDDPFVTVGRMAELYRDR